MAKGDGRRRKTSVIPKSPLGPISIEAPAPSHSVPRPPGNIPLTPEQANMGALCSDFARRTRQIFEESKFLDYAGQVCRGEISEHKLNGLGQVIEVPMAPATRKLYGEMLKRWSYGMDFQVNWHVDGKNPMEMTLSDLLAKVAEVRNAAQNSE